MPTFDIGLPFEKPFLADIRFAYLSKIDGTPLGHCGSLLYLRTMRQGGMGLGTYRSLDRNFREWEYLRKARYYAQCLVDEIGEVEFDAILTPPSRFPHALPYKTAFLKARNITRDFSGLFHRGKEVYAGKGPEFNQYCDAITCLGGNELKACKSLLIVDDILWRGVTAAAMLAHLRRHGLPEEARIHLACPLWIA